MDVPMSRRTVLTGFTSACGFAAQAARPNALFIIADDMNGYGFLHGYPRIQTPHIDKFRKTAITFPNAFCPSPACVPSRASFLSGLQPHTTGAYLNGCDPWNKAPFLTTESLPECFARGGYLTFGRGKQFHAELPGDREKKMWSNDPWKGNFGPFPPEKDLLIAGDRFWGVTPWTGPDSDFPDVRNADATIDFLEQRHDRPFFAMLGLWRPHTPFTAPKRFFDLYEGRDFPMPAGFRADDMDDVPPLGRKLSEVWGARFAQAAADESSWKKLLLGYSATTSFADWSAGRVLEALDRSAYANNTIVILVSDNGYHCGEKNHWEKNTLWDQAAQVPMAIRMPDRRNAGRTSQRTVGLIDIYPTLVDLCGLPKPAHELAGASVRPLLVDPDRKWDRPVLTTYGEGYGSIRSERYRYSQYPDGTEELFDHRADPHEWKNLASNAKFEPVKKKLATMIPRQWAKSLGGRLG